MKQLLIPLVDFYKNLLPAARDAGFKVVLTALVREADSPSFYEDIKRYWTSLHDVTGSDILFVFAGANAAKELKDYGVRSKNREELVFSNSLAMTGSEVGQIRMYIPYPSNYYRKPLHSLDAETDSENDKSRVREAISGPSSDFGGSHTLEIAQLRDFLNLSERELPCLVFTVLNPRIEDFYRRHIIVPLSVLDHITVYQYIKNVAEALEDKFHAINEITRLIKNLSLACVGRISKIRKEIHVRAQNLTAVGAQEALFQILHLSGIPNRSVEMRSQCFEYLELVKSSLNNPDHKSGSNDTGMSRDVSVYVFSELFRTLQRLIDLSFEKNVLPVSFYELDQFEGNNPMFTFKNEEEVAWLNISEFLQKMAESKTISLEDCMWDFFIAYPSKNRDVAERVFSEISKFGDVFLDERYVKPGNLWYEQIRVAHDKSRRTVAIITKELPDAWFAKSEIIHAIDLARRGKHDIIPILYGEDANLPYGLEMVHGYKLRTWEDLGRISEIVEDLVKGEPN